MDIESLHADNQDNLVRYLTRYCGDSDLAEDAAQEAFVRLSERPPDDDSNLRAWLYTVATRVLLDDRRTARRRAELLEADPGSAPIGRAGEDPETSLDRRERRRIVRAALQRLSFKERTVLLMREEGFSHREIAAAVDTTTGSVGTMIARALRKLARHLPVEPGAGA